MFVMELTALRAAFATLSLSESAITIDIHERDLLLDKARERMTQYRTLVEAVLGTNHPLTQSLPALQILLVPQRTHTFGPPQSVSVSVPFLTPSGHAAAWHFSGLPLHT
jgi:hypothetical protein